MRSLFAIAMVIALVGVLAAMSTIKPAIAAPAPFKEAAQPGIQAAQPAVQAAQPAVQAAQPGPAVQSVADDAPAASEAGHDPARFGKLDYKPPMDASSVMERARTGGDIACPGTEPCGP
jgi:hypothetical protein